MSNDAKQGPGGHYSARNPIPNIQKFIENMDSDKKERDARIDADLRAKQQSGGEAKDHVQGQPTGVEGTRKEVTDPTTGKSVTIEDVNADFMKAVKEPQVRARSHTAGHIY